MPDVLSQRKPRTVERRVAFLQAIYVSHELDPNGQRVEHRRVARRGELVTLEVGEAARLDALGALAPEGATEEDIERDMNAIRDAYIRERQRGPTDMEIY